MPVTIITPAYQASGTIVRAVKSALAQTYADWEMIIVADDGQDYRTILEADGINDLRLRFATTGRNSAGPGAARNAGLDAATHPIIAHLDSDDVYSDNYLSVTVPLAEQHGACNSALRLIHDDMGEEMPMRNMLAADQSLAMPHILRCHFVYANIVIDRNRCNVRWPEDIRYGEDLMFWLLVLDRLPAIYYTARTRYDYYFRKGSLSRPDEKDTHGLCARRNTMIEWLSHGAPRVKNPVNAAFMKQWLQAINAAEETFGYQMVDPELYRAELDRRLDALIESEW